MKIVSFYTKRFWSNIFFIWLIFDWVIMRDKFQQLTSISQALRKEYYLQNRYLKWIAKFQFKWENLNSDNSFMLGKIDFSVRAVWTRWSCKLELRLAVWSGLCTVLDTSSFENLSWNFVEMLFCWYVSHVPEYTLFWTSIREFELE